MRGRSAGGARGGRGGNGGRGLQTVQLPRPGRVESQLHGRSVSTAQAAEQPSPFSVPPSSQASAPATRLSPHTVAHVSREEALPPAHAKPLSTAHVLLHPSPFMLLPSSQPSAPVRRPFPHPAAVGTHTSGVAGLPPAQANPGSTWHVAPHPSPAAALPSSQVSPPRDCSRPSPHSDARQPPAGAGITSAHSCLPSIVWPACPRSAAASTVSSWYGLLYAAVRWQIATCERGGRRRE